MSTPTIEARPATVDFGDRSARGRRRRRVLVAVLAVLSVAVGIWLAFFSSILAVSSVRVVGVDGVAAEQVLAAAAVPTGVPLIRVDTAGAQARIVALPWVASVEVRRGWPNEIVVAVSPRVPIAVLSGSASAVDASGVTFDALGPVPKGLPSVSAEGVGLEAAMTVLAALPAQIASKVLSLAATTRDDVSLVLRSGATVRWGSAEQPGFKSEVLLALLRHKRDVYDVSAPELPTTFRAR